MATTATATATEPMQATEVEPNFPPHRMTVDRYVKLVDSGVYSAADQVFLWHGRLVEKMTKGNRHDFSLTSLHRLLIGRVPDGWFVRQEQPVALADNSMPEPDLTVVRGTPRDYLARSVAVRDIGFVVEVADSSVALDSRTKLRAYAAEGIPTYWIVNIPQSRIEVYSGPSGSPETAHYQDRRDYGPGEEVPVMIDGQDVGRIAVRDNLP